MTAPAMTRRVGTFTVITVGLAARSLQVGRIVEAQQSLWYVVWMPLGFVIYLITAAALSFWGPFATPVAADLGGGVDAELSGVDRLVFLVGRYVALVVAAAFAVPLFLGGGAGPLLPAPLWVLLKTVAVLGLLVWARWRVPLVRADRFEEFAWAVLIPATLVQLFVVCAIVLATFDGAGTGM
jgi:NADH-quinone oxidoreductase subunit H